MTGLKGLFLEFSKKKTPEKTNEKELQREKK